jgi:hypothetical protein
VLVGGLVIDFLGSVIVGLIGVSIVAASTIAGGGGPDQVSRDIASSRLLLWLGTGIGFGLTLLGGYVAARWAGNRFVLHGAAAGSISLVLGLGLSLGSASNLPPWLVYAGFILQVPLAAGGGWLAGRRAAH